MTEFEEKVIQKFVDDHTIKFCGCYVDDTLLIMKPKDIGSIHQLLKQV